VVGSSGDWAGSVNRAAVKVTTAPSRCDLRISFNGILLLEARRNALSVGIPFMRFSQQRKNHLCVGELCHIERAGRNCKGHWSSPGEGLLKRIRVSVSMVVKAGQSISQGILRIGFETGRKYKLNLL
jgi:hypothetical protein